MAQLHSAGGYLAAALAGSLWGFLLGAPSTVSPLYPVCIVRNLSYYQGPDADPVRHRLDLYFPDGPTSYPVLLLVHGGAWMLGDKGFFGWGEALGRYFASRGLGVVLPSYRLSPTVQHPAHVCDLARAVAWTVHNLPRYGGDSQRLFLCGHSAGGHLVCLLATDPTYLNAEKISPERIKGVIGVSGVYRIPAWDALRESRPAPASGKGGSSSPASPVTRSFSFALGDLLRFVDPFAPVFGTDAAARARASPVQHVHPGLPPFLLIYAQRDLPGLPEMAQEFAQALRHEHCSVTELCVPDRDHETVMFWACRQEDPVAWAIEQFLRCPCPAAAPPADRTP